MTNHFYGRLLQILLLLAITGMFVSVGLWAKSCDDKHVTRTSFSPIPADVYEITLTDDQGRLIGKCGMKTERLIIELEK